MATGTRCLFTDCCCRGGGAQGRNRTTDTRIFNPLLYRLSYLGEGRQLNPLTPPWSIEKLPLPLRLHVALNRGERLAAQEALHLLLQEFA